MTQNPQTITERLQKIKKMLEANDSIGPDDLNRVWKELEETLQQLNVIRCDVTTEIEKL